MKYTFDEIRKNGLLIYEYIRGSHSYDCNTEKSDVDTAGVFIEPFDDLMGLGLDVPEQVSDEKNDNVWYSLRKFMNLLLLSNPTVLESLFIDDEFVLYEHPLMTEIKKNRNLFVTKDTFKPFIGYATTQIKKARGLNKMIVNPVYERLGILDFCYTFYKQGSTKIQNWLDYRGMKQEYCGLVNVPNMHDVYAVYYDYGAHLQSYEFNDDATLIDYFTSDETEDKFVETIKESLSGFSDSDEIIMHTLCVCFINKHIKPIGYRGMISLENESNELRLSSVAKDETPICYVSYNQTGYTKHCIDYKAYKKWEKERNPERYNKNLENNKNYDAKNIFHSVRLMNMGLEIAQGKGVNVNRTNIDRELLMDIRNGKYSYDELIKYVEDKKGEMETAMNESSLPEKIDKNIVNNMLINLRHKFYNK
jgi:predicted nucleotidyltransferase